MLRVSALLLPPFPPDLDAEEEDQVDILGDALRGSKDATEDPEIPTSESECTALALSSVARGNAIVRIKDADLISRKSAACSATQLRLANSDDITRLSIPIGSFMLSAPIVTRYSDQSYPDGDMSFMR